MNQATMNNVRKFLIDSQLTHTFIKELLKNGHDKWWDFINDKEYLNGNDKIIFSKYFGDNDDWDRNREFVDKNNLFQGVIENYPYECSYIQEHSDQNEIVKFIRLAIAVANYYYYKNEDIYTYYALEIEKSLTYLNKDKPKIFQSLTSTKHYADCLHILATTLMLDNQDKARATQLNWQASEICQNNNDEKRCLTYQICSLCNHNEIIVFEGSIAIIENKLNKIKPILVDECNIGNEDNGEIIQWHFIKCKTFISHLCNKKTISEIRERKANRKLEKQIDDFKSTMDYLEWLLNQSEKYKELMGKFPHFDNDNIDYFNKIQVFYFYQAQLQNLLSERAVAQNNTELQEGHRTNRDDYYKKYRCGLPYMQNKYCMLRFSSNEPYDIITNVTGYSVDPEKTENPEKKQKSKEQSKKYKIILFVLKILKFLCIFMSGILIILGFLILSINNNWIESNFIIKNFLEINFIIYNSNKNLINFLLLPMIFLFLFFGKIIAKQIVGGIIKRKVIGNIDINKDDRLKLIEEINDIEKYDIEFFNWITSLLRRAKTGS